MHETQQIFIPSSFTELFKDPLRPHAKLSEPFSHISTRYDLCEDLAQMVCQTALNMLGSLNITEHDVIERILKGLSTRESMVNAAEARWVVERMSELLGWEIEDLHQSIIDCQERMLQAVSAHHPPDPSPFDAANLSSGKRTP
jgi:hypothetical protein